MKSEVQKISLLEACARIDDHWDPHIAGRINETDVRIARIKGAFDWHQHANEDEAFMVLRGAFTMEFRDRSVQMKKGDFLVVPRGTEHRPVADEECWIMLIEPSGTLNTGDQETERTRTNLKLV